MREKDRPETAAVWVGREGWRSRGVRIRDVQLDISSA